MVYRHVAAGGTFDFFHRGHMALVKRAVELGGKVTIGITSDRFAGPEVVEPFEKRRSAVEGFLADLGCGGYRIVRLEDPFGPAVSDESMDCIVVSEETYPRAVELNGIRRGRGLAELEIVRIPMLLAEDGGPLSSSRIRRGEIDREGRIR